MPNHNSGSAVIMPPLRSAAISIVVRSTITASRNATQASSAIAAGARTSVSTVSAVSGAMGALFRNRPYNPKVVASVNAIHGNALSLNVSTTRPREAIKDELALCV